MSAKKKLPQKVVKMKHQRQKPGADPRHSIVNVMSPISKPIQDEEFWLVID